MSTDRYVVLALAHPRTGWFAEVGRWANAGLLPVEFVRCVSAEEVAAHVAGGRPVSAALIDGRHKGADRDLVGLLGSSGCPVLVVDPPTPARLASLGAAGELTTPFDRTDLSSALERWAVPVLAVVPTAASQIGPATPGAPPAHGPTGRLVCVLGTSPEARALSAMAIAQGLAHQEALGPDVVLADLALDAVLGVLHAAPDVSPGVSELVEAHRRDTLAPTEVARMTFGDQRRGYRLLVGLRRRRNWTALRPRAVEAALASLRASASVVVAATDTDLDGEAECGSADVEERNVMARATVAAADLIVVASRPDLLGVHDLVLATQELLAHGVPPERLQPLFVPGVRHSAGRARLAREVADLLDRGGAAAPALASPLHVDLGRGVDVALRDARPLPARPCGPLATAVAARVQALPESVAVARRPEPVAPGSLGRWFDDETEVAT